MPVRTPHVDALAAGGTRFAEAFCCSSICSPSRAAMFTGKLPHRFGEVKNDLSIPAGTPNLAHLLRDAGYRTGWAGKWHVDYPGGPSKYGFEGVDFPGYGFPTWVLRENVEPASAVRRNNGYYEYLVENGLDVPELIDPSAPYRGGVGGLTIHGLHSGPAEASIPYFVGHEGVRLAESFARRRDADGRGFFLWVNFWGPHNPCYLPEPYFSMYDPADIPAPPSAADDLSGKPVAQRQMSAYWGMYGAPWEAWADHLARYLGYCTLIDDQVGRIVEALRRTGQLDNTIVVFGSDHGDMIGRHQLMDKGAFMYDDTYRVPLIVRGPGVAEGVSDEFVYLHDLFPTLLEWAGVEVPEGTDLAQSLRPLLGGPGRWEPRDAVFGEFDNQILRLPQRMIRTRTHKLIYNSTDVCELYDLQVDPHEMHNLIDDPAHLDVKADLKARLLAHLQATSDPCARFMAAVYDEL
jgi:arylsulfatase A-like enzyme